MNKEEPIDLCCSSEEDSSNKLAHSGHNDRSSTCDYAALPVYSNNSDENMIILSNDSASISSIDINETVVDFFAKAFNSVLKTLIYLFVQSKSNASLLKAQIRMIENTKSHNAHILDISQVMKAQGIVL